MTRLGLLIEANRCTGCNVCVRSCKDEFVGNAYLPYSAAQPETEYGYWPAATPDNGVTKGAIWVKHGQNWMLDVEATSGKFPQVRHTYLLEPCMQCENAPCQKAATGGAVVTRADGIVLIDPAKVGGQNLTGACPYGRIYWNADTNISQKCTLCAHRVDQGIVPRCVESCPVSAITFGDLDDPASAISTKILQLGAETLNPEYGTKPKVYYAGLPKPWLSGKLVSGKTGEFMAGVTITLTDGAGESSSATSDFLGDFLFGGLRQGQTYYLKVTASGMFTKNEVVFLDKAKDIGKLQLFLVGS